METRESGFLTQNENEQAYQTTMLWFVNFNFSSSWLILWNVVKRVCLWRTLQRHTISS